MRRSPTEGGRETLNRLLQYIAETEPLQHDYSQSDNLSLGSFEPWTTRSSGCQLLVRLEHKSFRFVNNCGACLQQLQLVFVLLRRFSSVVVD
jgi:hypothetical protein